MSVVQIEKEFQGRKLQIETGRMARLAGGSALVTLGGTSILVTCCIGPAKDGMDFFPLLVDYQEKFYATGKMKGSRFIKREGRPSDQATLAARMIDRPLRPLFPKNTRNNTQVVVTTLQVDMETNPEDIAILGASLACSLTGAPFGGPCAGVRVGLIDDVIVINPTYAQMEHSHLDLMVAGTKNAITMIEAGANEVPADKFLEALDKAHEEIKKLCAIQEEFLAKVEIKPMELTVAELPASVQSEVEAFVTADKVEAMFGLDKTAQNETEDAIRTEALEHFAAKIADDAESDWTEGAVKKRVGEMVQAHMRAKVLRDGVRLDGRKLDEIRPITVENGIFNKLHGTGLFTRGETQVLSVLTLGSPGDAQVIDNMDEDEERRYMHHYNFPGFSVGEVAFMRTPGRREIGHGDLAERALLPLLPSKEDFPYTMRVVSEVLMSNGSSSMGSVCGSTLCLMDGGVPIKRPASGIAMGLMLDKETGNYAVLYDIQGKEDFLGDMDFKVAGTEVGITALQLDIKIEGLTREILKEALAKADEGRAHILGEMNKVLSAPKAEMSEYAPRIESMTIPQDLIGDVIGPGGKNIRAMIEATETKIDIDDEGFVTVTGVKPEGVKKAVEMIKQITYVPTPGDVFEGKVVRDMGFGVLVEFAPNKDGLLHISEMAPMRIEETAQVAKVGDRIKVKVKEVKDGKISLTHKEFFQGDPNGPLIKPSGDGDRGGRSGGDRRGGPRGGSRDGGYRGGSRGGDRGQRQGGGPRRDGGSRGPRRDHDGDRPHRDVIRKMPESEISGDGTGKEEGREKKGGAFGFLRRK